MQRNVRSFHRKPIFVWDLNEQTEMGRRGGTATGRSPCEVVNDYESAGTLIEVFRRTAKELPDAVVIVSEEYPEWKMKELDRVTDALALHFKETFGAEKGAAIGIYMSKCPEYVISYIAALKAGCAYVPLDISYPRPLLEAVLQECQPACICTKPAHQMHLLGLAKHVFSYDHTWEQRLDLSDNLPIDKLPKVNMDDLAYTVYSSGTTGKPKGIQCPVRGAALSYNWRFVNYPYAKDDRVACNVFFVWELFRPIMKGIPMHIIPDDVIYDPPALCDFLRRHRITEMLFTPSLLQAVLDTQECDYVRLCFATMRKIWLCGEVVTVSLLAIAIQTLDKVQFLNLYSISETHDVAVCDLTAWWKDECKKTEAKRRQFAPVGKVFRDVRVAILDPETLVPQPIGVSGEIYVGGPTLALGYLQRPELDALRFIKTPEALVAQFGTRLYRSGDWGYLLGDGSLEICGRCDSMVKVRGYSVEIQAIESTLLQLSYINNCAVVVVGKEGEDKQLAAYVVLKEPKTKKELRAALKRRLPFYMIPTYFKVMDKLPTLPASAKCDKKALPAVDPLGDAVEPEFLPQSETEKRLALLWAELLQVQSIDIQESFFDMGGHSLLAARLLSKVSDEFGVRLAVRDLFDNPTVQMFAQLLDRDQRASTPGPILDLEAEADNHDLKDAVMDLHLRAFWRSVKMLEDRFMKGTVFLTGATGFLGVHILRELMKSSKCQVICLVRESPRESAEKRLRSALNNYGLLDEQMAEAIDSGRVSVLKGDVALLQFGLTDDDYHFVSFESDFVIHAAAYVNLVYPYAALYGGNVLGTQNVLLFCYANKVKPIHYISTDAVVPKNARDFKEIGDFGDLWRELDDGYGQSKWVAEQMIIRSSARGLPAFIYRLGNQAAHSELGIWNPSDFTYLMTYGFAATGTYPKMDWPMEMTPVDFTAKLIVTVATQRFRSEVGKIFHLVDRNPMQVERFAQCMHQFGYEMRPLQFHEWITSVNKAMANNESDGNLKMLDRLLDTLVRDEFFFTDAPTLAADNTAQLLSELGWTYPRIDDTLVRRYLTRMQTAQQMPKPTRAAAHPLECKVVVVTGASSGIGEAIATKLAVEGGARIACVARRKEKLADLCARIKEAGGTAIAVCCDVTDRDSVTTMVKQVESQLGKIQVLVSNAGIMYYTKISSFNEKYWQHEIDLNVRGTMNVLGGVLPGMIERREGHVVFMSSDAGKKAFPGLCVYSGTKFFIEGMASALRQEMVEHQIRITCIQPGDVQTELAAKSDDQEARAAYDATYQPSHHKILEPLNIADAVYFALSQPAHCAVNEILVEPREAPT